MQSAAKYHIRSARYILNPQDNNFIRLAGPKQVPWEEGTEIHNVSLTGLAFTAPPYLCPQIGESIKIQFYVPGSQQMACHATVNRLDQITPDKSLIGIQFEKLDMSQRIILAQGLALKLKQEAEKQKNELIKQIPTLMWESLKVSFKATTSLFVLGFIYYVLNLQNLSEIGAYILSIIFSKT